MTSIFLGNERRPQFFGEMEDDLNFFLNGRRPHYFVNKIIKQPKTFKIETMVVAPLRVTLLLLIVDQGNKNFILHDVFGLPLSKLRLSLFLWNFLLLLCCLSPIISFRLKQTLIQSNQVCIAVFSPPNTTKKDLLTTHMTRKQRKSKPTIINIAKN